jgi:hypothetical protein
MNDSLPKSANVRQMVIDFLFRVYGGGKVSVDALAAAREMRQRWGVSVDWHEFAFVLGDMERHEEVVRDGYGPDGHARYRIL